MEETGGDGDDVEFEVDKEFGDGEGVDQIGFTGPPDLAPVLEGREDVGPPEEFEIGVWTVRSDLFEEVLEANHWVRCLTCSNLDVPFFASLYWPGFGHGKFLACFQGCF